MADPLRQNSDRSYKRGAIMGLTVAEAFILLAFCLLLLFSWWQAETERKTLAVADMFGEMSDSEKRQIVDAIADGSVNIAMALKQTMKQAGLPDMPTVTPDDAKTMSRFMSDQDLRRLMKGAAELPPDTLLTMADLVEIGDQAQLVQIMNRALRDPNASSDPAERAAGRLADAISAEKNLLGELESALGEQIRNAGGSIGPDGTITLPQSVLFNVNEDRIKNPAFLHEFCPVWLQTMRGSGVDISELKIEGHASSEGPPGASAEDAYLYNLALSQRRAQNALTLCLNNSGSLEAQTWARDHLIAVGYSSNKRIMSESGQENREESRRVMFSAAIDRERLLQDIGTDLTTH